MAWNTENTHSVYIQSISTHTPKKNNSEPDCPRFCECDHAKNVYCSSYYEGFSFNSIPSSLKVRSLNLFGGLKSIPVEVRSLTGLRKLDLSRNSLTVIDTLTVGNPNVLQTLDLSSNDIVKISPGAFTELVSLEILSLSENNLQTLPKDLFQGLTNLKTLRLSFNRIFSVPLGLFDQLHSLEELDLRSNVIHWIPGGVFQNLTNLKTLKLSENNLQSLSHDVLADMKNYHDFSMELYGNPWDCSCKLENFLEFLFLLKANVSHLDMLVCYSPSRLLGSFLLLLRYLITSRLILF